MLSEYIYGERKAREILHPRISEGEAALDTAQGKGCIFAVLQRGYRSRKERK